MQLYLIRHGQSTNNARWRQEDYADYDRESDPCLTEIGVRQAQLVGNFLSARLNWPPGVTMDFQNRYGFGLTHLYCSLMVRAVHTGSIISRLVGLPLVALPLAHEVGGVYVEKIVDGVPTVSQEFGGNQAFYNELFPFLQFDAPIDERGWWQGGRENVGSPLQRARAVIKILKDRHFEADDRVALVTHGAFYSYLFRAIFEIAPEEPDGRKVPASFPVSNCSVSRFDFTEDRVWLSYHNRVDFIPDEFVTY